MIGRSLSGGEAAQLLDRIASSEGRSAALRRQIEEARAIGGHFQHLRTQLSQGYSGLSQSSSSHTRAELLRSTGFLESQVLPLCPALRTGREGLAAILLPNCAVQDGTRRDGTLRAGRPVSHRW
jgi:hypothetical protein